MGALIDLTGKRFNKLTALNRKGTSNDGQAMWECVCDCGETSVVDSKSLRKGGTKTCGCSRREPRPNRLTHGECATRLYSIWSNMKNRCHGTGNADNFKYYGGRGISVCDEWRNSYEAFRDWATTSRYSDELTIDRIDNDGDYCPDNCRWVPLREQFLNRRSAHNITFDGRTLSVQQWAKLIGVSHSTIISRKKRGVSLYG